MNLVRIKKIKKITSYATAFVFLAVSITAIAAGTGKPKLTFFKSHASIGWSNVGGSSPADTSNTESIQIVVPGATGSGDAGAYTYGNAEAANTIVGRKLSAIDRLGFRLEGISWCGRASHHAAHKRFKR